MSLNQLDYIVSHRVKPLWSHWLLHSAVRDRPRPCWSCKYFSNIRDLFPICFQQQCSRRAMPFLKAKKKKSAGLDWGGVAAGSGAAVAANIVELTTLVRDRRYNTNLSLSCACGCKWRCGERCLDWRNGAIRASAVLSEAFHTSYSRKPEQRQVLSLGLIWSETEEWGSTSNICVPQE